jgi:chromosome partitioning protein
MAKTIAFFNHKGGVGKTTNAFHIAWKIAEKDKKVLLVDADPQCNLTGLALGIDNYDQLDKIYDPKKSNNLYHALKSFVDGTSIISPSEITPTKNENLFILPGHVDIAQFDDEIATAVKIARPDNLSRMMPLVSMYSILIDKTAKRHNVDVVIIDMSPSISSTNMCLLMGADYFIIPTAPDFFSHQAIDSLSKVLPKWPTILKPFKDDINLPRKNPKMLGILHQNYRVYNGEMASAFLDQAKAIDAHTNIKLVSALKELNMVIDEVTFKKQVSHDNPYNLGRIQNFNSLIPKSQEHSKPIYSLTDSEIGLVGAALQSSKDNSIKASKVYDEISESILSMI